MPLLPRNREVKMRSSKMRADCGLQPALEDDLLPGADPGRRGKPKCWVLECALTRSQDAESHLSIRGVENELAAFGDGTKPAGLIHSKTGRSKGRISR